MTICLIDAENVRRSVWPNLDKNQLLNRSIDWANREGVAAWIIFDGPTPDGAVGEQDLGGHRAVGTAGETADEWIIRKARELKESKQPFWLITSDRVLRDLASGAERTLGGGTFARELKSLGGNS